MAVFSVFGGEREDNLEAQKTKLEAFEVDNPPFELEGGGEPELV